MDLPVDITRWSITDVGGWLKSVGFEKFEELICLEHEIDGKALLALTEDVSRVYFVPDIALQPQ